jgi:hypothetical protein
MAAMSIDVVCDSPHHARGKVAKVGCYYRTPRGGWQRDGRRPQRAWRRRGDRLRAAGIKPDLIDIVGPELAPQKCKLCGATLTLWADSVLFPVLDRLAARGVSRITIRRLDALVSNAKG